MEKAIVRPPSCSPKSSFYSFYGAITAGDHGKVEVVSKLSSMGTWLFPFCRFQRPLEETTIWIVGDRGHQVARSEEARRSVK